MLQSILSLFQLAFDLVRMAYEGVNHELYDAAVAFFELLVVKSLEERNAGIETIGHLYNHKNEVERFQILLNSTKKAHDHKLDKRGQFDRLRRCNQYPYDPELRKKKKFQKEYNATVIRDRQTVKYFFGAQRNDKHEEEIAISTMIQVDKLCRGNQLRVISSPFF